MPAYRCVQRLELDIAGYIAGLIDGEGTITLSAEHRGQRRSLVISISNTDRALLEFVRCKIGAGRITSKRIYSERHTPSFCYKVTNRQALDLLTQTAGYLRTYRSKRAAIALDRYVAVTPRNGKYSPEILRQREAFERELLGVGPGPRAKSREVEAR